VYGGVRVADVVLAIRDLEPGFYTVEEVRERYQRLTGAPDTPRLHHVARIVGSFGLTRHVVDGEDGWTIDPARLAPRWSRLPWTD
jgi:hypothetical protein